ncbi:Tubulin/FtsZ, GTPase domain protein [Akanthomyces lecanii RCEF 1005]|uniref:Tubulin/FtsZ, GTPase domain protein n=1 Tax=Akanthomyces lecanii RCEF 1005 TaxID=1081108 RepID=A0A168CY75_CORDF|nr:Tubulin/FtsZ, GTPase domain protein [Akanthomyces lecanii RCEF 1005]
MREIVTLQLGHLSNYVATHFWNTQESYFTYSDAEKPLVDHDVHWRTGVGADGSDTFLPRTVVYDLKGGFGSLRKINALYDVEPDADAMASALWAGKSTVHKQEPLQQSAYLQSLDAGSKPDKLSKSNVRYWSDFSRAYYHPKSLNQLYDYELHSSIQPFERFDMGKELFHTLDKEQDIVDRDWRPFVEECDHMQGIQVLATIDDAWGGFASSYLETLRDEYPKQCIWVWGLQSPLLDITREKRRLRLTNAAHSISEICQQATTFIPMSLPEHHFPRSVRVDCGSPWHTSALLSAAVESTTLPSRLLPQSGRGSQRVSLDDISQIVNTNGTQTLAGLRMGLGAKDAGSEEAENFDIDLFGIGRMDKDGLDRQKRIFGKSISSRGEVDANDDADEDDQKESRRRIGDPVVKKFSTPLKFPMLDSYPDIFPDEADQESVRLQTALFTDQSISTRMKALKTQVTWAVGVEERELLSNSLAEIGDEYHDDWSSGSDDGEDD